MLKLGVKKFVKIGHAMIMEILSIKMFWISFMLSGWATLLPLGKDLYFMQSSFVFKFSEASRIVKNPTVWYWQNVTKAWKTMNILRKHRHKKFVYYLLCVISRMWEFHLISLGNFNLWLSFQMPHLMIKIFRPIKQGNGKLSRTIDQWKSS